MSSITSASFVQTVLSNELQFYSPSVSDKVRRLSVHCFQVLCTMGNIFTMSPMQISYVVNHEATSLLPCDAELHFVVGLSCKIVTDLAIASTQPQFHIAPACTETPAPAVKRSPNPMVSAIMNTGKAKKTSIPAAAKMEFPTLQEAQKLSGPPPGFEHLNIPKKDIKILKKGQTLADVVQRQVEQPAQIEVAEHKVEEKLQVAEPEKVQIALEISTPSTDVSELQKYRNVVPDVSYCAAARAAGVDEPVELPVRSEPEQEKKKPHFFQFVQDSGFVDPKTVDDYMTDDCDTCLFITDGVTEEEVMKYLMKNFPRTEYYSNYVERDDGNFRVRISFNGLSAPEKVDALISSKLEERDFVDIFTTYSESAFMENIKAYSSKYFTTSKEVDDRILSIRFFKNNRQTFVYPTKKSLEEQFKQNSSGKVPVAFVYNMPLATFNTLTDSRILGYKFILTKKQPEDTKLRSLMVFKRDTK